MAKPKVTLIDGFDPLEMQGDGEGAHLVDQINRRIIENILKSYTGYFDVFSEMIQNSLDAIQKKASHGGASFKPKLWIKIDLQNSRVSVVDNGVGMSLDEFKFFLRPNVSYKDPREGRGHKGVGATFLAYGFSLIKAQSTKDGKTKIAALMRQGRNWAEDRSHTIPRPKFEEFSYSIPELAAGESGTSIEVMIGKNPGERPRDLGWLNATRADQWVDVLRIKTPLGGVYLNTPKFAPQVKVTVVDHDGTITSAETDRAEYYYPNEIPDLKVQSLGDVQRALNAIAGSPDERFAKLKPEFKRLDCLYEVWDKDALLAEDSPFASTLETEDRVLIEKHRIVVYAAFLRSAKMWAEFNDDVLKLRKGQRIMHGGLQMASDCMVQGDLSVIPLTSSIGYQANSHVIVHLTDGNPDMGRKVFQPELKSVAEALAVRAVNLHRRYLQHLKPDTGARGITPDRELYDWRKEQEVYRDSNPLSFEYGDNPLTIISEPQQEQDVIALFHQLIGLGVIKGIQFFATSQNDKYDSLFNLEYQSEEDFYYSKGSKPLGVSHDLAIPHLLEPKVLEYKYDLDALISDFDKEIKFPKHIDFVVCWKATKAFKEKFFLNSILVGDEGNVRQIYGATHQAFSDGNPQPHFEVLILDDLLRFLRDPESEEARQKQVYGD
jgi:hypothetical protein